MSIAKKKVLMFLQYGVGGAERMTVLIGKYLNKDRFEVKFVVVKKEDNSTPIDFFIPKEYPIITLYCNSFIKLISQFYTTIKKEKADIVFSSVLFINNKLLPLCFFFRKTKFIIRCENYLFTFSKKQKIVIGLMYKYADAIIAQTEEMKYELIDQMHISSNKVFTLENPVDEELIKNRISNCENPYSNYGKKHFVASGRFSFQKGFDLLVDAFKLVTDERDDVDLYIIGKKEGNCAVEYDNITRKIKDLGLSHLIQCVGFQENPYVFIKYADCFVLSSRWEGLPNVLIESLFVGTPVAAFKCIPVIDRIVTDGQDGFKAEKEDIVGLSKAMLKAIDMGKVKSVYSGSKPEDFTKLFD